MFQTRQYEETQPLIEVSSSGTVNPGAVANNTVISVTVACTLPGGAAATFALGDELEVFAPAAAATNGLNVTAAPTATAGTCVIYFQNGTLGSITPVSQSGYRVVATRIRPDTF